MKKLTPFGKITTALASIALIAGASSATAGYGKKKSAHTAKASQADKPTIVGVAASNTDFETLVAAVKAAGLVETLNSTGPFTVFAPNDNAFDQLPDGTVATLVQPENKAALTSILTYHVLPGKVTAQDVLALLSKNDGKATVTTVQGGTLTVSKDAHGALILTDALGMTSRIIATDVMASNGVIHVIDKVVMP